MELDIFPPRAENRNGKRDHCSEENQCLSNAEHSKNYTDSPTADQEGSGSDCMKSSFVLHALSGLYAQLIVVFAGFMVFTEVLHDPVPVFYFHEYLFNYLLCGGVICLLGVYIRIWIYRSEVFINNECKKRSEKSDLSSTFTKKLFSSDISLLLRIGTVLFGMGMLITCVLEIASIFTMSQKCTYGVNAVQPSLRGIFTFLQIIFLSLNIKEAVKMFGWFRHAALMHLVATNLSVWMRILLWESSKDWLDALHYKHNSSVDWLQNKIDVPVHTLESDLMSLDPTKHLTKHNIYLAPNCWWISVKDQETEGVIAYHLCLQNSTIGVVLENAMPYLYPFIVQYCLLAASLLYTYWSNLSSRPINMLHSQTDTHNDAYTRSEVLKCDGSTKGLFIGILILIAGLIIGILSFAFSSGKYFDVQFFVGTYESFVYVLSSFAAILGLFQIRKMKRASVQPEIHNYVFQKVGLLAVYAYGVCNVIAGAVSISTSHYYQVFAEGVLTILQASIQSLFIQQVSRKTLIFCNKNKKPRGQVLMFLIFANIVLWFLQSFTSPIQERSQLQMMFYGNVAWPVISKVIFPLVIFYRFHSAAVFVEAWRECYSTY